MCTTEQDLKDAQAVCKALNIPLYEVDFINKYWTHVFEAFLSDVSQGLTPNPDLACNSHIKFGALLEFAVTKGADVLATGHYARIGVDAHGEPTLLRGADPNKDQSYFLAGVSSSQLSKCMFPVGEQICCRTVQLEWVAGAVHE